MVSDNTIFNIVMFVVVIGIASIVLLAVCDYNAAEETCSELKSEEDCSYEVCMAEEYKSDEQQDKIDSCMLKIIYKNDALKQENESNE